MHVTSMSGVPHLRCSGTPPISNPALTGRANLCRASGADTGNENLRIFVTPVREDLAAN